ncbi:ribonuclease Y [bacterium]|nr:ribonuclease Y [bacterium]
MQIINTLLIALAALLVGGAVGFQVRKLWAAQRKNTVESKIESLIAEAKTKQKEILLQANDKALKIIEEAKVEEQKRQDGITHLQQRLENRESKFDQQLLDLEKAKEELTTRKDGLEKAKEEIEKIKTDATVKLEKISGLSKQQATDQLLERTEAEVTEEMSQRVRKVAERSAEEVEAKAREMMTLAMQRCASSHSTETTTSNIELPNDELKGRIIGKEGRNIRSLEQQTGVEIIVDDTPGMITISGFSPIRRQVAKKALEQLLKDGRIHPARIEAVIEKAKQELAVEIKKAGEQALYEVGITGLDDKLVQILGRLKYRTSYGQNILRHSVEVTRLAGFIAEELGADVSVAKKGALFHDIGKAVDHEVQGGHPQIGYDILKKFHIPEPVAYIAKAHHDDSPETLECIIVKVADAISGARPGARKDTYEQYVQRLEELERVATSFEGIDKAYAVQAGREVRVFVVPEKVDDNGALTLAREVAKKIEAELTYPGEIKITMIREKRIIEFAR